MAKFEIKDGVAIIPEGTTEIGEDTFYDYASLESVIIPESVMKIGDNAFGRCASLESITLPESVASIGWYAFTGCTSLKNITLPDSVTFLGENAFSGCTSLESITISNSVTRIDHYAFNDCTSLESITIPESVTEIDSLAFLGCSSLKCVTFLSRTKLGDEVFSYSSRITINVPSDCVDYYKEVLPEEFHDNIVEFEPEKKTKVNHIETIKEIARHLGTIIEKIDSLDFCPICWEDSFALLYELRDTVEQIDKLSEQLEPIFSDDSFWNDPQNKDLVKNIEEADKCFIEFSSHFSRIDSVLEEEGPKEWYDKDYEYLSAQLKKAKQHLDQILK